MRTPRYTLDSPAIYTDTDFIERLSRAGSVLSHALRCAVNSVEGGVRPIELAEIVEGELADRSALPIMKGLRVPGSAPFPSAAAVCVNEVAVNGVPSNRPLTTGDILTIDSACEYEGAVCDAAVSVAVGGGDDPLIEAAQKVLDAACCAILPGRQLSEIARVAQETAQKLGYEILDEAIAHGTGLALHQPPAVFIDGAYPDNGLILPGMVLAVEPVVVEVARDGWVGRLRTLADGWSRVAPGRSAFEERTVVVTELGTIALTGGSQRPL